MGEYKTPGVYMIIERSPLLSDGQSQLSFDGPVFDNGYSA